MPVRDDHLQNFEDGLRAGHEAGRDLDLVYAAGFLVGFVWGALFNPQVRETQELPRAA